MYCSWNVLNLIHLSDTTLSWSTGVSWKAEYSGCFKDYLKKRVLKSAFVKLAKNSVSRCINYCVEKSYNYAGMENGNECYCAKKIPKNLKVLPEAKCSSICPGNTSQKCGGKLALNIYFAKINKSGKLSFSQ